MRGRSVGVEEAEAVKGFRVVGEELACWFSFEGVLVDNQAEGLGDGVAGTIVTVRGIGFGEGGMVSLRREQRSLWVYWRVEIYALETRVAGF